MRQNIFDVEKEAAKSAGALRLRAWWLGIRPARRFQAQRRGAQVAQRVWRGARGRRAAKAARAAAAEAAAAEAVPPAAGDDVKDAEEDDDE